MRFPRDRDFCGKVAHRDLQTDIQLIDNQSVAEKSLDEDVQNPGQFIAVSEV